MTVTLIVLSGPYEIVIVGTTTLLVEPKFIFGGGRVGHIEDVCVRKEFQGLEIGSLLVKHATTVAESWMGCVKIVPDCILRKSRLFLPR